MKVAVLSAFFPPAYLAGGPIQTLRAMVKTVPSGVEVDVFTSNGDLGRPGSLPVQSNVWTAWNGSNTHVYYAGHSLRSLLTGLWKLQKRRPDCLYANSFFGLKYSIIPQVLAAVGMFNGTRIVVAPRGEFNTGALSLKQGKKRLFLTLYRALGLHKNIIWHASNESEAYDIQREFGDHVTIVICQNDTLLPLVARRREERMNGVCRLVFASRLSEIKRLDLLLRALQSVQGDYRLRVVGAFEDQAYARVCHELASADGVQGRVKFLGACTRGEVLRELEAADAFVFPTAGENFGHIIAESLSVACPVITTKHTPWTRYVEVGGQVVNGDTDEGFASAIDDFVAQGPNGWADASVQAGLAFERWRHDSAGPHFFDLLRDANGSIDAAQ